MPNTPKLADSLVGATRAVCDLPIHSAEGGGATRLFAIHKCSTCNIDAKWVVAIFGRIRLHWVAELVYNALFIGDGGELVAGRLLSCCLRGSYA